MADLDPLVLVLLAGQQLDDPPSQGFCLTGRHQVAGPAVHAPPPRPSRPAWPRPACPTPWPRGSTRGWPPCARSSTATSTSGAARARRRACPGSGPRRPGPVRRASDSRPGRSRPVADDQEPRRGQLAADQRGRAEEQLVVLLRPQGRHDRHHRRARGASPSSSPSAGLGGRGRNRSASTPLGITRTLRAGQPSCSAR